MKTCKTEIGFLLIILLFFTSCTSSEKIKQGNGKIITFNECMITIPNGWCYKTTESKDNDDVIWIFKNKDNLPWIDLVVTNDKPERDIREEIKNTGKNNLITMITYDSSNDYSIGGGGRDVTFWNREGCVAEFDVTDNKNKEENFKYLYFGSRVKNTEKVLFITVTKNTKDDEEVNKILDTLKIKNE